MILFIKLLLAHLLGDFVLQPNQWVKEKEHLKYKSLKVYFHALIHFALILLITADAQYITLAAIIAGSHLLIDIAKLQWQKEHNKKKIFFADQALHVLVLLIAVYIVQNPNFSFSTLSINIALLIGTGLVWLTNPTAIIIKIILSKWEPFTQVKSDVLETKSLQHAGMVIGIIERLLVYVFILNHQWAAIGFLITAKSVFRFSDLKIGQDRKLTEYILIGTLLSFGIAIITGIIIQQTIPLLQN